MTKVNKGKKRLALVLAVMVFISLFPVVYAEETDTDFMDEDVTPVAEYESEDVTEFEPADEETPDPAEEPEEEPDEPEEDDEAEAEEADEPGEPEKDEEPDEPDEPEAADEAEDSGETQSEEMTPAPEPAWDPSAEEDEQDGEDEDYPAEEDESEDEEELEDEELFEFDDDDMGSVSEELLEQFNNPDTYEHVEFGGTADIELVEDTFTYGQTVTLVAKVQDVDMSYRLVWEATDGDERGWYTIGSGSEYSFEVTPENIERGYRVVLFTVD